MTRARDLANSSYAIGPTSSRPASPYIGQEYYDTTLQELITYSPAGQWTAAGAVPLPVVTGGTLTSDATYYYRTFTGTNNLTVTGGSVSADILTVAGGGGAGSFGGGGGAGGVVYTAAQLLSVNTYTVTVGAGGVAGGNAAVPGNGVNSTVTGGSLTLNPAVGGGYGAGYNPTNGYYAGNNGGCGGGANWATGGYGTGSQGGNGGAGYQNSGGGAQRSGGGGGGMGGAGYNGSSGPGGNGGSGINTYSTWLSATSNGVGGYVAGGGGGATNYPNGSSYSSGGSGGGGNGGSSGQLASAGVANTGSGGGSDEQSTTGSGAGGSGLVIIRYTRSQVGG